MRKEPREYISPLLHPPLNRLFISRPRLEPFSSNSSKKDEFPDKPKPSGLSQNDVERLYNYKITVAPSPIEQKRSEKANRKKEKTVLHCEKLARKVENYKQPKCSGDAFRTVFLGRLPYGVSERVIRRELAPFGSIIALSIKKGFAFVELEREKDVKRFVKENEEIKIEGRRVLVDVERARTVEGWLPRRLGGGLGGRNARGRDSRAVYIAHPLATSSSSSSNTSLPPAPIAYPSAITSRTQIEYDDF